MSRINPVEPESGKFASIMVNKGGSVFQVEHAQDNNLFLMLFLYRVTSKFGWKQLKIKTDLNEIALELRARTIANFSDSKQQWGKAFAAVIGVRCTRTLKGSQQKVLAFIAPSHLTTAPNCLSMSDATHRLTTGRSPICHDNPCFSRSRGRSPSRLN